VSISYYDIQISYFMKIRPMGAELFDSDGRKNMINVTVAYRSSANAHKNPYIDNINLK
jgi:hypothetical protein